MLFLSLKLASELYAVESLHVKEVLQFIKITRVPRTGSEVCGVVNLRGSIVTVFDLRSILGMAKIEATPLSNIVVLEYPDGGTMQVRAILVDGVQAVVELDQKQLNPPPATRRDGKKHLQHLAKHGDGFILILNVASLFGLEAVDTSEFEDGGDSMDIGSHEPQTEPAFSQPSAMDSKITWTDVNVDAELEPDSAIGEASTEAVWDDADVDVSGEVVTVEVEEVVDMVSEQASMDDSEEISTADVECIVAPADGDKTLRSSESFPDEQTRMLVDGGLAAIAEVLENEEALADTPLAYGPLADGPLADDEINGLEEETFPDTRLKASVKIEEKGDIPHSATSKILSEKIDVQSQLEQAVDEAIRNGHGAGEGLPSDDILSLQEGAVEEIVDTLIPHRSMEEEINNRAKKGDGKDEGRKKEFGKGKLGKKGKKIKDAV